jgi:putative SOS response-associated peptidase YedK
MPVTSCTIVTTTSNEMMLSFHERMPVILDPEQYDQWLDTENTDIESLKRLLFPYPANRMIIYPVSPEVNTARHEGKSLMGRI